MYSAAVDEAISTLMRDRNWGKNSDPDIGTLIR